MTEQQRGLTVAVIALVCVTGAMMNRARAQESAGEYWARERGEVSVAAPKPSVRGRKSTVAPGSPMVLPSHAVAAYAARFVGRSGPSLGLPSRLWCASFANMILASTGHRTVASRRAIDMLRAGPRLPSPQVGALAINGRRGGAHVSIIAAVYGDGSFLSINGNGRGRRVTQSVRYGGTFVMPVRG